MEFRVDEELRPCIVLQPTDARRAFPCWDEPAVRATFDMTLVVPKDRVALSNMVSIVYVVLSTVSCPSVLRHCLLGNTNDILPVKLTANAVIKSLFFGDSVSLENGMVKGEQICVGIPFLPTGCLQVWKTWKSQGIL